jgi:hypothetical protein
MLGRTSVVLAASVLVLPACLGGSDHEASVPSTSGRASPTPPSTTAVSAKLSRPLHFPRVADGRCPASPGRYVATPDFASIAIGTGPVRVAINNAGDPRHGFHPGAFRGWLALKTHFFSLPSYQGPFLVRAKRLDRPGPVRLGATPTEAAPLVVPPGANAGAAGWREFPSFTFVKAPGCYAWQVDGLKFSDIIVVRMLPKFHA